MEFGEFKGLDPELLSKSKYMEKITDYKELDRPIAKLLDNSGRYDNQETEAKKFLADSTYEIDGNKYETDDNGSIYKMDGRLMPDIAYEKSGIKYTTDYMGRIVTWSGKPRYEPENERDTNAQSESGGEDREDGDDGGHLEARVLGGSAGKENIVPMRYTINRGDYKRSENEIIEAKKQGKDVYDSGRIIYEDNSTRPSKIERTHTVDGEKNFLKVDNVKYSENLLDEVKDDISDRDMESIYDEIADMKEDGCDVSVTSIFKKYDVNGNLVSVRVGIKNETVGEKSYRYFNTRKEG